MPRPLKVATPEVIVAVALKSEPELEANWAVMVPLALVTTLPEESSTFTTGWVAKAAPLLAVELGAVVTTIWVAAPAPLGLKVELVAEVSPLKAAVKV